MGILKALFSAYSPDIEGCVATGRTRQKGEQAMKEPVVFHLEGLRADGRQPPSSHTYAAHVDA